MNKYEFVISAKDKTGQAFDKINSRLGSTAQSAARVTGAVAAVAGSMALLTMRSADNAKELESLSRLAGVGVEEFQAYSYAFERFNISQEKFADISKDVNDKLGDFLATGAGPFADFFENVAPKVGVTAQQLRDLSGPDVLIAVKKAMDDANVSAKEQVFYMEALASDATLLLPALQDNGQAIKEYAEEFNNLNVAMNGADIKRLKGLADEMDRIQTITSSIGNKLSANFAEPLADLLDTVDSQLPEHLLRLENATRGFAWGMLNTAEAVSKVNEYNPFARLVASMTGEDPEEYTKYFSEAANEIEKGIEEVQSKLRGEKVNYQDGYGATDETLEQLGFFQVEGSVTNIATDAAKAANQAFLSTLNNIDELRTNPFDFGKVMKDGKEQFWKDFEEDGILNLKPTINFDDAAAQSQGRIDAVTSMFNAIHDEHLRFEGKEKELEQQRYERQMESLEREMAILERKGLVTKEMREQYQLAEIEAARNHFDRLDEIRAEEAEEAGSYWEKWLEGAEENLTDFKEISAMTIESFSGKMGDAFESVIFDSENMGDAFKGVMNSMLRGTVNAIGQMIAQWFAYQAVQMVVGKSTAMAGAPAKIAEAQAASLQAGLNAFSSTAAIPMVGPAMAPGAMGAALAVTQPMAQSISAIVSAGAAASFEGGGFTGYGIRSGGVDGRGGYNAILHPNEYVVDLTKPDQSMLRSPLSGGAESQQVNNYYSIDNTTHANNATPEVVAELMLRDKRTIRRLKAALEGPR